METEIARSDALTEDRVRGLVNSGPDLEDSGLYFNRELSWLDFNDRVLQLAEDPSVPLLERVKFAAIWESNLDELFMVRVANLHDQVEAGAHGRRPPTGWPPTDVLDAVRERVLDQRRAPRRLSSASCARRSPSTGSGSSRQIRRRAEERASSTQLFERQVFPVLTPLVIGRGRPFPYISNLSLSLAVVLRDPEKDNEILARVKVPKELLRRFLAVGDGEQDPGPARRADRRQPRVAVPRDGGARPLALPGHPRHRLRRLRRGRRPAAGGRGGAPPPPLRRGGAARDRRRR